MDTPLALLVPIDFSPASLHALAHALAWAARTPTRLHLLHVMENHGADGQSGDHWLAALAATAESALLKLHGDARDAVAAPELHLAAGHAAPEIIAAAARLEVAAIVMGSQGGNALRRLVTGSVEAQVVRDAARPVLCVAPDDPTFAPAPGRPILCAVDFSDESRAAMAVAAELARRFDVELLLLHVYEAPGGSDLAGWSTLPMMLEGLQRSADATLDVWRREARGAGCATVTIRSQLGAPPHEIGRIAGERGCATVVIGTAARTGLSQFLLSSVAERIVREAPCPVLTVRAPAAEAVVAA